jgi:NAD(P)-dependent dehydrogenase (short-subunit alcohol dehydrogenase family)
MNRDIQDIFSLSGKVAIITGGAGMLGVMHAEAIAEYGGCPVLADIDEISAVKEARRITDQYGVTCLGIKADITRKGEVQALCGTVLQNFGHVDILINNAANDPKVKADDGNAWSRFENFTTEMWQQDIAVGLTGTFLCSQIIGSEMANKTGGVILNISSDLGIIAPDQRIYAKPGLPSDKQPVKPVSYSVVKTGLIGLTKYLATYWTDKNVRVNALCPGGVKKSQPDDFIVKLSSLIPMGRMARKDEYKGAIIFLVSDASSYMTGATLVIDGGRSCW